MSFTNSNTYESSKKISNILFKCKYSYITYEYTPTKLSFYVNDRV